jgi:hypothetical protein
VVVRAAVLQDAKVGGGEVVVYCETPLWLTVVVVVVYECLEGVWGYGYVKKAGKNWCL